MRNNTIKDLEQFRKEIEQDAYTYVTNIAKNISQIIADEMYDTVHSAIEDFYAQWDPEDPVLHNGRVYYYRHWNFRKSYKRYYKNRNPFFVGGIYLLPDVIPDVYQGTNSSPQAVFDRVYLGYHGIASFNHHPPVPMLKPSPIRQINDKYRDITKNLNKYEKEASDMARKNGTYIRLFKKGKRG